MPRKRAPYPLEFRQQMVGLVRAGRTPEEQSREFEPSAQAIRNRVTQAERDAGRRLDGLRSPRPTGRRAALHGLRSRERSSMGSCYDNAMGESLSATLECELLDRTRFRSQADARLAVFEFIEGWYNPRRRHSAFGYLSPVNDERSLLPPARPSP